MNSRMPQVTAKELISFLRKNGFEDDRQKGSHLILHNAKKRISITIPVHTGCDIGRGLAKRILADAGFSIDDYLNLR